MNKTIKMKVNLNLRKILSVKILSYKIILIVFSLSFFSFISNSDINSKDIVIEAKPNFIFYLADDQDKLDYGTYGNPNVDTKAVDRLASEGIKFNNFYTNNCITNVSYILWGGKRGIWLTKKRE